VFVYVMEMGSNYTTELRNCDSIVVTVHVIYTIGLGKKNLNDSHTL
jgi:hypothetical protein